MNKYYFGLLASLFLLASGQTNANTYAIVIGIDAYKNVPSLDGAANDANLIAHALTTIGVKPTLFLNGDATRNNIKTAWENISAQAKKGDTVYFTYAGHGAQQPERIKNTEEDGQDEFYVLANFAASGADSAERLMDDALRDWFAKRPDLNIVLVSDSCHSGTMTRSYKKNHLKYRNVGLVDIQNDALPSPTDNTASNGRKTKAAELAHIIAFAGVPDHEEVPELTIEKQTHGALSWHFSKGITGLADTDKNGVVTAVELKDYVLEQVRMTTQGQQHPQVSFINDITLAQNGQQIAPATDWTGSLPAISFSIIDNSAKNAITKAATEKLMGIELVEAHKGILEWDVEEGVIRNTFNDKVYQLRVEQATTKAYQRKGMESTALTTETAGQLQAVIDKFRLVEKLTLASDGSLEIKILPNDKLHFKGESVKLSLGRVKYPYLTLINLAVDGNINFLYPIDSDALAIPLASAFQTPELEVSEPFGADHFVAITSDKPLSQLHEKLQQTNNSPISIDDLKKALETALKDTTYQLGIHASFTEMATSN